MKLNPDGFLSCLKARMVAKGFSRHVVWIIMDFFGAYGLLSGYRSLATISGGLHECFSSWNFGGRDWSNMQVLFLKMSWV